ncbi:MAG: NUDIX hydrolase [Thermodesulfobacteriota bacterium]|nr:NUDIX hydrolase [Thermodesulfobacteriota bacterium]
MTAIPRDAATTIIIRDVDPPMSGIEVLMVQRHEKSHFAGNAYVFPGGVMEESDYEPQMESLCLGLTFQQAKCIITDTSHPERALGFFIAAIRETFEEVGILFAYQSTSELLSFDVEESLRFDSYRKNVQRNLISFKEMILNEKLLLAVDQLNYFAHWITPEAAPIRFDTHFFIAPAPTGQAAVHDTIETTQHLWISPKEALNRHKQDLFPMLPPTVSNLNLLSCFSNVDEAVTSMQDKKIPTILPRVVIENGKTKVLMPWDNDV